jgi:hypothetical protein
MKSSSQFAVTRLGASRFAWNSDGVFGAGTQIEITSVGAASCSDVPRGPAQRVDPPRIAGRVACAYTIKDVVESREQTISSEPTIVPHRPLRFRAGAYGCAIMGP